MKEFAEGLCLCTGIGAFYLSVSAMEQGAVGFGLSMFFVGFALLCLMLVLVYERK